MAVVDAVNELYSNTLLCNRKSVEKLAQLASKVLSSFALFLFLLSSLPGLALPPYLHTHQRFLLAPECDAAGCCLTRCKESMCTGGRRMCTGGRRMCCLVVRVGRVVLAFYQRGWSGGSYSHGARTQMPSLKNIIYTDEKVAPADKTKKPVAASGINIYSFDEVIAIGQRKPVEFTPPKAKRYQTLACPLSCPPHCRTGVSSRARGSWRDSWQTASVRA